MIEIVFFDAGETILRPHPSFAELFSDVCRAHGRDVAPADVALVRERLAPYLVDLADEGAVANPSLSPEASRSFWTHLYRRFLQELGEYDEALAQALFETFSDTSSYKLFDDVLPVLDRLRSSGFRLGLISNFEGWLQEMLVELEVGHLFDVTVISGIEGVEKPDPRIYELALARAGVAPERAVHVGDSIVLDVEPAAAVGMRTVLVDRAARASGAPATATIASLEELPSLMDTL